MNGRMSDLTRRTWIAGALVLAVGLPTLACSGAGTGGDAEARAIGTWGIRPSAEEMRKMQIINMGLNPKATLDQLQKKLKPPPTEEEKALFQMVKQIDPNSDEAAYFKDVVKMLKDSSVEITDSAWVISFAGERQEMTYTVESTTADVLVTKTSDGSTNTLTFKSDDEADVVVSSPSGTMNLVFKRK